MVYHLVEEKPESLLVDQMVEMVEKDETLFLLLTKMKTHYFHTDIKKSLKQKIEKLVEQKINMVQTEKVQY